MNIINLKIESINDLANYARTNLSSLRKPIRSIVLQFQGLNRYMYLTQPTCETELVLADHGDLFVIPYTAPWNWMNESALRYTDWLLDEIFRLFDLPKDLPIVSTGYSMGGLAALIFPIYSSHKVTACMANSPVCDLVSHFHERIDLPRTILNAFITYPDGLEAGIESHSPLHQVDKMPDIPYWIVAGGADEEVIKARHSDRLIEAMKARGLRVTYHDVEDMQHWQINRYDVLKEMHAFLKGEFR
ncbi:MAG: prolyl oligopeptidase family serine peptidase [Solobacterium sp.]|nr:prolyl oligopeptidase family serine peptidase [Solobacterium sp.]